MATTTHYCQDNPISWVAWSPLGAPDDLTSFVASLSRLRLSNPVLQCSRFFRDGELAWLRRTLNR